MTDVVAIRLEQTERECIIAAAARAGVPWTRWIRIAAVAAAERETENVQTEALQ